MSHLVVIAFDSQGEAEQVHQALADAQKQGILSIRDTAVVVKDEHGKTSVKNQVSSGTWTAAGVGGALGLLVGTVFFPLAGIALGAGGGALVGRLLHLGVDGKFVQDVQGQIEPDSSALFILTDNENLAAELAILRQHHGKVLQTNLPEDAEEAIRAALGDSPTR